MVLAVPQRTHFHNIWSRNIFPVSMEGCVLYLPLWQEDMQKSTLISYDHYHHFSTVTGALWSSQGRSFDGVDDRVAPDALPQVSSLSIGTIVTVATMTDSGTPDTQRVVLASSDKDDASSELVVTWIAKAGGDHRLAFFIRNDGAPVLRVYTATQVNPNETYYFGVSVSASGNLLVLNGQQDSGDYLTGNSSTRAFFADVTALDTLHVGINQDSTGYELPWEGVIQTAYISRRPWSLPEHQRFYTALKWIY